MQTIKVSIEPTANGYEFCNGNTAVARITNNGYGGTTSLQQISRPGRFLVSLSLSRW